MGYTALLIFAGLQTIPAQRLRGGRDRRRERVRRCSGSITLPLLRPVLALVLIITVIGSFQVFDTVAVTTQGGPVNASSVHPVLHLRARRSATSTSATPPRCRWPCSSILIVVTFAQCGCCAADESDLA